MNVRLKRTNSRDNDFASLVKLLDADLAARDGTEHDFYAAFNIIDKIPHVILLYADEKPVSCGAMKELETGVMEIKRMYTLPASRGNSFASRVLLALEKWAAEIGYKSSVLETGKRQPEAIALYQKSGYQSIPNYGQYAGVENSVCFGKTLN